MKAKHYFILIILFIGIFLVSSCQKDETLKPNGIKLAFQAITGLKSSADTLIIDEAFIGIGAIDLKREGEADSAKVEKIVYNGPYVVDLLNGNVSPAIRWIFAEPGYYNEIDVTTYNSLTLGRSIILKGTLFPVDGEKEIPFEFFTSRNYTFKIESNDGITVNEGEEVDLLVVFNLSDLFRETDLTEIKKNEKGIVVISEDVGVSTIGAIVQTFEAFSSFGINDGLPFTGDNDVNPDNEVQDEVENSEEDNNGGDDDVDNSSSGDSDEDEHDSGNNEQDDDDAAEDDSDDREDGDGGNDDATDDGEDDGEDDAGDGDNDDSEDDDDDKDNSGKGKDNNPGKGKDKKEDKGKGNKG